MTVGLERSAAMSAGEIIPGFSVDLVLVTVPPLHPACVRAVDLRLAMLHKCDRFLAGTAVPVRSFNGGLDGRMSAELRFHAVQRQPGQFCDFLITHTFSHQALYDGVFIICHGHAPI